MRSRGTRRQRIDDPPHLGFVQRERGVARLVVAGRPNPVTVHGPDPLHLDPRADQRGIVQFRRMIVPDLQELHPVGAVDVQIDVAVAAGKDRSPIPLSKMEGRDLTQSRLARTE